MVLLQDNFILILRVLTHPQEKIMQQHDVVTEQFGKTANAYLSSAIHAQGADLVLMQECARRHGKPVVLDLGCGAGHASQVGLTSHSCASSSRRKPGVRRRPPPGKPAMAGVTASRRARMNSASLFDMRCLHGS